MVRQSFRKMKVAAKIQYFNSLEEVGAKSDLVTLGIQTEFDEMHTILNSVKNVYNIDRGSELTTKLVELDHERGLAEIVFRGIVKAQLNHFNTSKSAAAQDLWAIILRYGNNISQLPYQEETAVTESLCTELRSEDNLAKLVLVGAEDCIDYMDVNNTLFQEKYIERALEDAGDKPLAAGRQLIELQVLYTSLCNKIDALCILSPSEELTELVKNLEAIA